MLSATRLHDALCPFGAGRRERSRFAEILVRSSSTGGARSEATRADPRIHAVTYERCGGPERPLFCTAFTRRALSRHGSSGLRVRFAPAPPVDDEGKETTANLQRGGSTAHLSNGVGYQAYPSVSPQPARRAALNTSPSRLLNRRSPALPSGWQSFSTTLPEPPFGGAITRAGRVVAGCRDAAR